MKQRNTTGPRRVEARRWLLLGTAAAAGLSANTQVYAASEHAGDAAQPAVSVIHLAAATEGGEGGEGGEAGAARPGDEDAHFLADLAYIEGHLRAGIALYEIGAADMAKTHMKHPEDEIYSDLKPQLESRGADQFDAELAELAAAVEGGAPVDEVKAAFGALLREMDEARERVGGGEAARLEAIVLVVREAAEEYEQGVNDGKVVKTHEYQDAWGFVQAASAMTDEVAKSPRSEVQVAASKIRAQFAVIDPVFPALIPKPEMQTVDPGVLFAAAARMELASSAVK